MNMLLDTHALLWYLAGSSHLSTAALAAIQDPANILFVSPATLWEISIKDSLGKLTLPQPFAQLFPARLDADGILLLPILVPICSSIAVCLCIIMILLTGSSLLRQRLKTSP